MKKIILFAGLLCLSSMSIHLHAQSINNRNWKAFFSDPFNDTLTLHIHADSSFVTNSKGDILVRTNCIITGDTLTMSDYAGSEYSCPDARGKYKINLSGKNFTLKLIDDSCEGRARTLDGIKWTESVK